MPDVTTSRAAELVVELPMLDNPGREGLPSSVLRPHTARQVAGGPAWATSSDLVVDLPEPAWRTDAVEAISGCLSVWGAPLDAYEILDLVVNLS